MAKRFPWWIAFYSFLAGGNVVAVLVWGRWYSYLFVGFTVSLVYVGWRQGL
jgi:hypothetical protein